VAIVHLHRESPGAATGVSQAGVYVGAGGGPAAFGALYALGGYTVAWLVTAAVALVAAFVMALAGRRVALAGS
jgi:predicted MFS family arabinose efflux permease